MATFTVAIANSIGVFGPAPSTKWAAHNWNAFLWGEGTNNLVKVVSKSFSEQITLTDSLGKTPTRVLENSLSLGSDMTLERVYDSNGYTRLFPGGVSNGEDRISVTWTLGSQGTPTWTIGSASATVWS